jgi:sugar lactone lactonase YvrE
LAVPPSSTRAETVGAIYVVDNSCCSGPGGVIRVDPTSGSQTVVSSGQHFELPAGIALAADGTLYVVDADCCGGRQGGVIRVDPSQPAARNQTVVSSVQHFVSPSDLVLAADGTLYVADSGCCGSRQGGVIGVDPTTGDQTVVSSGQHFELPSGIAVAPDGTLYVLDWDCCDESLGGVIRVDPSQPATSNQTVISSGQEFRKPIRIALAADGKLYVVSYRRVVRVDPGQPATSNQTMVSSDQNFVSAFAIALAADGKLYVADSDCCGDYQGGVIRVDPSQPATSNQTVVSSGQNFGHPSAIALAAGL